MTQIIYELSGPLLAAFILLMAALTGYIIVSKPERIPDEKSCDDGFLDADLQQKSQQKEQP